MGLPWVSHSTLIYTSELILCSHIPINIPSLSSNGYLATLINISKMACAINPQWSIHDTRVMNWLRNYVGDVTQSPITELVEHACAVTQTLQIEGKTTFCWDYKFVCICKWESKIMEVRNGIKNSTWRPRFGQESIFEATTQCLNH